MARGVICQHCCPWNLLDGHNWFRHSRRIECRDYLACTKKVCLPKQACLDCLITATVDFLLTALWDIEGTLLWTLALVNHFHTILPHTKIEKILMLKLSDQWTGSDYPRCRQRMVCVQKGSNEGKLKHTLIHLRLFGVYVWGG